MPQQRHQIPDHLTGVDASILSSRIIALRERIDSLLRGTMQLAEKLPSTNGELFPKNTEYESLPPHQLVVMSNDPSANTRLLNAFADHEFASTENATSAPPLTFHRFGNQAAKKQSSKDCTELYHPHPFFKHIQLIEASLASLPTPSQQALLAETLDHATLVFIALSSGDSNNAIPAPSITSLLQNAAQKIILVVNHDDANAAATITRSTREKIGLNIPAFDVTTPRGHNLDSLREHVTKTLLTIESSRRTLDDAINRGEQALRNIEDQIESLNRKTRRHDRFMDEVEQGFTSMRVSFASRLPGHIERIADIFNHEATIAQKRLKKRLHPITSITRLFTGGRVGIQMHSVFTERIQQAVMEIASNDSEAIAAICREHYHRLCEKTKDEIGSVSKLPNNIDDTLQNAKEHFLARIEHSVKRGISDLGFRNPLEKRLRRRNRSLKSYVAVALSLTILGASSGAMGIDWLAALLCTLAALFFAGAFWAAWISRRSVVGDFKLRLDDACSSFGENLHFEYETAIGTLLAEYATSLKPLRAHIDREKQTIEPLSRRWQELFLGFRALAQEL